MSPKDDDTLDVLALFGILRRRKFFVLTFAAAGALVGLLLGLQITTEYTAQATIVVEPQEDPLAEAPRKAVSEDPAGFSTQQKIIRSRAHIARVMEDLGLFDDPEFNAALRSSEEKGFSLRSSLDQIMAIVPESWLVAAGLANVADPVEPEAPAARERIRQRAIDAFQSNLKIGTEEGTYIITVDFTSTDPAKAALIANRTADVYVESQIEAKGANISDTARWLREQIKALREQVRTAEAAVERFRADHDLIDVKGVGLTEQELSDINKELVVARANLAEQRAKLQEVEDLRRRGQLDAVAEVVASPVIVGLRQQETELLRKEAELAQEYGERHPLILQLVREKANLQAKIEEEIARTVRALESEAQVAEARVEALGSEIEATKTASTGNRATDVELRELEREAEAARSLYETLLQNLAQIGARQDFIRPDVRVLSVAKTPEVPSSLGLAPFTAAGFTVSLVFGGLLALMRERLDRGLRSARETRATLGLPVLALVPKLGRNKAFQKPHRYLAAKPMSIYCESIRSVYTALRLGADDNSLPKVVMVTSALPGEGKTTFAVSLATFAACTGHRTLLVDFDLRHQRVADELDLPAAGLLDTSDPPVSRLTGLVQQDPATGIDILLIAGNRMEPTSFFDRPGKIADLLTEVGTNYDLVILDSAPAIVASETRVAALHADMVIYAIRWGETSEVVARDGLEALKEAGANVVGAVITMVDLRKHAQYGYEDVAHYYGKYDYKYYSG